MKLKFTLLSIICCTLVISQNFREVQLPKPDKLNPLFIGPIFKSTIHYGATPPNFNGELLVFNHGYIDLGQLQFLFDNDFYQNAYDNGYQAVFVATTRGNGLWVNGALLAESIDIITKRFNVPQVTIIAHSNGGKAAEAAMIRYGKNEMVKKVFALGTPFWGTYIADVSQMPWLNWAWRLTGLNDGALTSTTYYNRDVVRPYLDNDPNNDPDKFVILGASGYWNGSNLLIRGAFTLTGGIILPIQGSNDGVASYSSTLRPGGEYIFRKQDPRAFFDHVDVGIGQFSWPYIQNYLDSSVQKTFDKTTETKNIYRRESDYYIIHSDNQYETLTLDANATYALAEVLHENEEAGFNLQDPTDKTKSLGKYYSKGHYASIPITNRNTILKSDSKYVAFIKQNSDMTMILELKKSTAPLLDVSFTSNTKSKIVTEDITVRGVIIKKAEINGTLTDNNPEIIEFKKSNNGYQYDTARLQPGVYSLFLNAESPEKFKRSIISGFVVGDPVYGLTLGERDKPQTVRKETPLLSPSVIINQARLTIPGKLAADSVKVTVFDITGKTILSFSKNNGGNHQYDISGELQALPGGMYLMKVNRYSIIKFLKQ